MMNNSARVGMGVLIAGLAVFALGVVLIMQSYIDLVYAEMGEVWAPGPLLAIPIVGLVIALGSLLILAPSRRSVDA